MMISKHATQTYLSTIASIRSSKSKYISLFEYRAFGRRHGMGAEYGGLVWLSELVQGCLGLVSDLITANNRRTTYPDTPAAASNFRTSVGGNTISFNMFVSIVNGCPSSSISSIS